MLNIQPPEPFDRESGAALSVHSIFPTIQGEGPFTGHTCIFLRLAGCNLQCPHCDTEYTSGRQSMTMAQLVTRISSMLNEHSKMRLIVITGGEPLRQDLAPLCTNLVHAFPNVKIQIESNGVLGLRRLEPLVFSGKVHLVVSPKTSRIHADTAMFAHTFKYVLSHDSVNPKDGLPMTALGHKASPHVARPPAGWVGQIYVNPMDAKDPLENERNIQAAVESCQKHGYIFGMQVHKYINVP